MGFLADPQKGLVPIGGNFFATPDTPADPRDCDRFPNSPWCGGGFLDRRALAIDPQIISDKCNLGVSFNGTLAFIRLPTLQIVHRNPNCQPESLPRPSPDPKAASTKRPPKCTVGVIVVTYSNHDHEFYPDNNNAEFRQSIVSSIDRIIYPSSNIFFSGTTIAADFVIDLSVEQNTVFNSAWVNLRAGGTSNLAFVDKWKNEGGSIGGNINSPGTVWTQSQNNGVRILFSTATNRAELIRLHESNGVYVEVPVHLQYMTSEQYQSYVIYSRDINNSTSYTDIQTITPNAIFACGNERFNEPPPPPKPPPKMECCPGQQNNDALLKLILKRIGTLPVDVQTSYLTKNGVQPVQTKSIESLTDFIAWFAERHDETIGEFEINIEVKDEDNSHTVRLPNLAEAIAEIFTMLIHSSTNSDLILNIANRTLIESGQIKQSEFKTFSALNALIDYVGFHTDTATEQMPLTFTPGELSFDKFLKEFTQDVSIFKYTQKDTLAATMHTLLQAAAIIRAVHYRKTPGSQSDIASIVKEDLKGLLGESGNLTDQVKTFITNVEKVYDGINNKPA